MNYRIGLGIDFHRLVKGRKLILAGVEFDYPLGLLGHSDADVVAHSCADALLGAVQLGDLGRHFPDTDPKYKNANSLKLLNQCLKMTREKGYQLVNIDSVVILEEPKLADKIPEMQTRLGEALEVSPEQVSIKATRPELMGALGRKEGIACISVCLVKKLEND